MIPATVQEFKDRLKRHATVLRTHGLLDPQDRVEKGHRKYERKTEKEKMVSMDLLDELFKG